jgi:hypothetical protein
MARAAQLKQANHATLTVLHVAEAGLSVAVRDRLRVLAEESLRDWYAFFAGERSRRRWLARRDR